MISQNLSIEKQKNREQMNLEKIVYNNFKNIKIFPGSKDEFEHLFNKKVEYVKLPNSLFKNIKGLIYFPETENPFFKYNKESLLYLLKQDVIALINAKPFYYSNGFEEGVVYFGSPIRYKNKT